MPFINVKLTNPLPDKETQDKIASEITEIFIQNLGKVPERTVVVFEGVNASDFYFGGKSVEDIKKGVK
ncbi:4-oxalocrotonate tautomerase family protein [Campylobacter sp. FMV-PI01]|uniref:4-oxalocrotonate tautomerase family protein n=1 Tax=Campylobacter portucalensis TaxID=2608384 RepID=A0A6L5WH26_9BACT|nr:4-oxalocrotonate tautomerase family protein [Campylobacter portucalensis]MSN95682.1 4-oxalocrotonate tautomerase family protein [Campylobacter portucalensis]